MFQFSTEPVHPQVSSGVSWCQIWWFLLPKKGSIEEVDKSALIVLWMYLMLWINLSSVTIGSCDFEHGRCTWTEAQSGDDFDWKQGSGRTTSGGTGPSSDHTLQSSSGKCRISHLERDRGCSRWILWVLLNYQQIILPMISDVQIHSRILIMNLIKPPISVITLQIFFNV